MNKVIIEVPEGPYCSDETHLDCIYAVHSDGFHRCNLFCEQLSGLEEFYVRGERRRAYRKCNRCSTAVNTSYEGLCRLKDIDLTSDLMIKSDVRNSTLHQFLEVLEKEYGCLLTNSGCTVEVNGENKWLSVKAITVLVHELDKKLPPEIDPFYFCTYSGCEAASNDCWKTCPDSTYNRTRQEVVKELTDRLKDKAVTKYDWNDYVEVDDIDETANEILNNGSK